jgi:hypothetical protein
MGKYFVFVWFGAISVLVYLLVEQLAKNYLNAVGYVAPEPSEEEFDPSYANDPLSLDPANPFNCGHTTAFSDDGIEHLDLGSVHHDD